MRTSYRLRPYVSTVQGFLPSADCLRGEHNPGLPGLLIFGDAQRPFVYKGPNADPIVLPLDHMTGFMYSSVRSFTYSEGKITSGSTPLIREAPLKIKVNGTMSTMIMCTPGMARELVTGFLFTEGLIESIGEIESCEVLSSAEDGGGETVEVRVTIEGRPSGSMPPSITRVSFSSSGLCGRESYHDLAKGLGRVKSRHRFSMEVLMRLPAAMSRLQPLYRKTGGAHAAFLFDAKGTPLLHAEDMGRHNALDKVIGASLLQDLSCDDKVLLSSGRASLEMILKTARAAIPVFVANSRPTSRAVEAAEFYNITLIDMARGSNRIYSHVHRIEGF